MKPKTILIATGIIILLSGLLTGCRLIEKKTEPPESSSGLGSGETFKQSAVPQKVTKKPRLPKMDIQELVQKAAAVKKEVTMTLEAEKKDGQVSVSIILENPSQKPITSVQSWLSFDATKIKGKEIDTSESPFLLMAPDGNGFDNINGLAMIGRSSPEPITSKAIHVAKVIFDIEKEETTMIDVYDYREDLTGHTSANTIVDGEPYNILIKPDSPALIIEN